MLCPTLKNMQDNQPFHKKIHVISKIEKTLRNKEN